MYLIQAHGCTIYALKETSVEIGHINPNLQIPELTAAAASIEIKKTTHLTGRCSYDEHP